MVDVTCACGRKFQWGGVFSEIPPCPNCGLPNPFVAQSERIEQRMREIRIERETKELELKGAN